MPKLSAAPRTPWSLIGTSVDVNDPQSVARILSDDDMKRRLGDSLYSSTLPVAAGTGGGSSQRESLAPGADGVTRSSLPIGLDAHRAHWRKKGAPEWQSPAGPAAAPLSEVPCDALLPCSVSISGKGVGEEGAAIIFNTSQCDSWHVAGFVSSSFPIGHPAYSGGRALCSRRLFLKSLALQSGGATGNRCSVRAGIFNMSSTVMRCAEVKVL